VVILKIFVILASRGGGRVMVPQIFDMTPKANVTAVCTHASLTGTSCLSLTQLLHLKEVIFQCVCVCVCA